MYNNSRLCAHYISGELWQNMHFIRGTQMIILVNYLFGRLLRVRTHWTDKICFALLKLINNSLSLNKGNHDRDGVWISDLNQHRFLRFYFSIFSLVLVSIKKIYQTLETVFHQLSKHLEFHQKYCAARRIFNSLLGVWISDGTLFLVFDILLPKFSTKFVSAKFSIC